MSAKLHPNFPTALCRDKDRLRSFLLIFRIKGIVTVTLKSVGVALATVATKATANIIIIAQARAIGNRQLATKSRVVAEVSSPTSYRPRRESTSAAAIFCNIAADCAGRETLTPDSGAVPASSDGRIDE